MPESTRTVRARRPRAVQVLAGLAAVLVTVTGALLMPLVGSASADPIGPPPTLPTLRPPITLSLRPPAALLPLRATVVGDSYTSGEGAGNGVYPTVPGTANEDFRHQSPYAPFHLAWAALELNRRPLLPSYTVAPLNFMTSWGPDQLTFLPASGAETTHLDNPLMDGSTVKSAPMLDGADPASDLVFFGLGGNDAGFGSLMRTALNGFFEGTEMELNSPLANWKEIQTYQVNAEVQRLRKQMPDVATKVTQGLEKTHAKMGNAAIVVSLYPLAVRPSGNVDIPYLAGTTLDAIYPFAVALNEAVMNGAIRFAQQHPNVRVHIFDPNTAGDGGLSLVAGHELGRPDSYFNGVVRRKDFGLTIFHQLQESFHPNQLGSAAIGKGLAKYLADTFPQWFPNGSGFDKLIINPQPNPNEVASAGSDPEFDAWAMTDPGRLCEGVEPESLCGNFLPDLGLVVPVDLVFLRPGPRPGTWVSNPNAPGGPPYFPGGDGTGGGGNGGGGGEPGGWTPAGYPTPGIYVNDPCHGIFVVDNQVPVTFVQYASGSGGHRVEHELAGGLPPGHLRLLPVCEAWAFWLG